MTIKNYTTNINPMKTIGEIEILLANYGAKAIMKEFNGDSSVKAVNFMVGINEQDIPFKIPFELNAWVALINQVVDEGKLAERFRDDSNKARAVGWRVIKDWIDAQLALVSTKSVKIQQVFLPYAIVNIEGQTLYEKIESKGFGNLQLIEGKDEGEMIK